MGVGSSRGVLASRESERQSTNIAAVAATSGSAEKITQDEESGMIVPSPNTTRQGPAQAPRETAESSSTVKSEADSILLRAWTISRAWIDSTKMLEWSAYGRLLRPAETATAAAATTAKARNASTSDPTTTVQRTPWKQPLVSKQVNAHDKLNDASGSILHSVLAASNVNRSVVTRGPTLSPLLPSQNINFRRYNIRVYDQYSGTVSIHNVHILKPDVCNCTATPGACATNVHEDGAKKPSGFAAIQVKKDHMELTSKIFGIDSNASAIMLPTYPWLATSFQTDTEVDSKHADEGRDENHRTVTIEVESTTDIAPEND
ncbi:hypothetical protein HDU67_004404, partial [Dinochytrium kinnereticum]